MIILDFYWIPDLAPRKRSSYGMTDSANCDAVSRGILLNPDIS